MTDATQRPRALVVGLGIAGIATAVRLRQVGWEPVLLERAAERRSGGYFIVLFGAGRAAARRLGALDGIGDRSGPGLVAYEVNRAGRRHRGIGFADLPEPPRSVLRSDVEQGLFAVLPGDVEIRYSTVPTHIAQDETGAQVTLRDTTSGTTVTERFDLVVGADGMRSTVRELVFGPHRDHLDPLDYMIGATLLDGPVDGFAQHEGLVLAEPGRSVWTFPFRNHPPSLLFSYRTEDIDGEFTRPPIESIRAAFGPQPAGPLLESLLTRFDQSRNDVLFDSVHQVKMPQWHRGRVVLVGDAAWCLTLYSGMGASSGIAGGDLLGTMLHRHRDDVAGALRAWEARMRPFIEQQQRGALMMRTLFTPHDRRQQIQRATMLRLRHAPVVGRFIGRIMAGNTKLKDVDVAAA
jgi:2-polyprenyl-6-methoxyphenol hydroxylase-like FAD-dependent oxidoreductase